MSEETQELQPTQSLEMMKYEEAVAKEAGLPSPRGMQILKRVCTEFVQSGFAPVYFKNNPSALFMAALRGRELGLSPAESIFETFWAAPGGRLGMFANKMLDLMHRGGVKTEFLKNDGEGCEIRCSPKGDHIPFMATFYYQEAVQARIQGGDNWRYWPADMCKARAISRAYRALAGTFEGGGNFYSKEEIDDMADAGTGVHGISTTAPASESDRVRGEQLAAQAESDFNPGRKSKVVEIPKEAKVNGSPIQEAPAPPPPAPSGQAPAPSIENSALWENKSWVRTQMDGLKVRVGGITGNKRPGNLVNNFCRGFLGVKDLPNDSIRYKEPLLALGKILEVNDPATIKEFTENPELLGARLGNTIVQHPAQQYFDLLRWGREAQEAAKHLYEAQGWENAKAFHEKFILGDFHLERLTDPEVVAFCRIVSRIRDGNDIHKLHSEFNVPYVEILNAAENQFKTKVENISVPELIKAINQALAKYISERLNQSLHEDEEALPFGD